MQGPFSICCIYCHKIFFLSRWDYKGWHTCEKALAEKRKLMGRKPVFTTRSEKRKRNTESYHRNKHNYKALKDQLDKIYRPDPKKLCPVCKKVMTVNKYACSTCLNYMETKIDIDATVTFQGGIGIHRRGMGTVCRVGGGIS